jgi:hypothetical protein
MIYIQKINKGRKKIITKKNLLLDVALWFFLKACVYFSSNDRCLFIGIREALEALEILEQLYVH